MLAVEVLMFNPGARANVGTVLTTRATDDEYGVIAEVEVQSSIFGSIVFFAASPIPTLFCACTFTVILEILHG